MDFKKNIRSVTDFPKKGIVFRDITTLLKDPDAFRDALAEMKKYCSGKKIDVIVGIESRGFIIGSVLAHELGVGFIPVRKPGKLPADTIKEEYSLEYGKDAIEIHKDAVAPGQNVLIVDDLLATGGTVAAAARLVERLGGKITGLCFLIELTFLKGREKIKGYDIFSLVKYDSE
jgi:adenine phosphoribosyltransferase